MDEKEVLTRQEDEDLPEVDEAELFEGLESTS